MRRGDEGSAIVEFVWLAVLLMVPLLYVVLTAVTVQRAAFGAATAAREAARAYATAGSDSAGEQRAELAAQLAMSDQGMEWAPDARIVTCGECTYAAGSAFAVDLHVRVRLPFVPRWMCSERCVAGLMVSAHHRERLDCFSGAGVVGSTC
ncbi:MAG TPA: hypothetical protein VFH66_09255 [Mycobacteriales bacterium]|nr:hypothetical protein [Mycobacteriales bacterium]